MKINTRVVTAANLALAFSVPLRSSLASPIIIHHGPKHENSTRSQQQSPATSGTFASASMNQYLSTERHVTSETVEEEVQRPRQERERKTITSDTRDHDDKSTRALFFHRFRRPAPIQSRPAPIQSRPSIFRRPAPIQPPTTATPSAIPTTARPSSFPSQSPSQRPITAAPSASPTTAKPSVSPSRLQSNALSTSRPTAATARPTSSPTRKPTKIPTRNPTTIPTSRPTSRPTSGPQSLPAASPVTPQPTSTPNPSLRPASIPSSEPTEIRTRTPTTIPTSRPTSRPTFGPTSLPTVLPVTSQPTGVQIPSVRFNIDLVNVPTADPNRASVIIWDDVIHEAADKWEHIIVGDLPTEIFFSGDLFNGFFDGFSYDISPFDPASPELDDIAIGYDFVDNLPSSQLGSGTWTRQRSGATSLPFGGGIHFNSNLITADPNNDPAFREKFFWTAFHEMGHSLGIGTMWIGTPFVCATSCTRDTGGDYSCPEAQAQFETLFPGQILALAVDCGHWLQSQFDGETWFDVMAPNYDLIRRPLATVISVGAMQDLGYVVNFAAADDPNALSFQTAHDNLFSKANVPIFDKLVEHEQSVEPELPGA